ncbi:Crp/Fnr family transcriptional regulator [Bradyrhizobium barranii subsp. apii]|uniref:Crp/Fnr family transcriptional regulator n=1 Tax=Bradyrhizobium barranii subsp. apii TaxID=2819348 RepID=A0A8T5UZJ6_9BRAD|nr:Crp/Fnr family transcriptional regulator [Bradyrhizobium barranii]UPT88211.1 Crp/Fnr family transcriptional regulator [Bradyrhizobium barranii subsp. apii]
MKEPKHSLSGFETYFATPGAGKAILSFKKNALIFSQGDPAETIFYIQKGRVKLHVVSDQGKEAVVALMEAGQFFGEGCLNGDTARVATAVSLGDSKIVGISKLAMRQALKDEPNFAQRFVTYLIHRTSRVEEDLIDQLFNSSERRLARLLLLLAHFGKEGVPQPIDIDISQETLAEMIGTTRSRVSFFMNKFRKLGFISYNGKIHVHNSLLNAVLHDKPALRTDD